MALSFLNAVLTSSMYFSRWEAQLSAIPLFSQSKIPLPGSKVHLTTVLDRMSIKFTFTWVETMWNNGLGQNVFRHRGQRQKLNENIRIYCNSFVYRIPEFVEAFFRSVLKPPKASFAMFSVVFRFETPILRIIIAQERHPSRILLIRFITFEQAMVTVKHSKFRLYISPFFHWIGKYFLPGT